MISEKLSGTITMNLAIPFGLWFLVATVVTIAFGVLTNAQQKSVTVEGYVLDSACAFTKNLDKPISRDCALACAKNGSQLVILTGEGSIYWPISEKTPAEGQNTRLVQFAGHRIQATGKLYERGGSHALVIEEIHAISAKK